MKNGKIVPPILADWILRSVLLRNEYVEKSGDLEEVFCEIAADSGQFYAKIWFWSQVLKALPVFLINTTYWRITMFRNYFKIAVRNLLKHKGYSFINISGLAIGMACCILIMLWVHDELSYDKFHEKADKIYRLTHAEVIGGNFDHFALSPFAAAPAFTLELPEVISYTRIIRRNGLITVGDKKFDEAGIVYVDSTFFEIFTFEFVIGDPAEALDNPNSIVLTKSSASKLFGSENPLGKTVNYSGEGDLTVTGVIYDVPKNSHFKFNYAISSSTITGNMRGLFTAWLGINGWSYILLADGADPAEVESKFPAIIDKYTGDRAKQFGIELDIPLQKLTDIHLRSHLIAEFEGNGDIDYVYIFSLIAAFILLIACINFMNLSTARSAKRGREVGLRKVFGAYRNRLVSQFLSESLILSLISISIAVMIAIIFLPAFNELTGKEITVADMNSIFFWLGLPVLILFTGIVAGSYPAFFLSAFQPVNVLKSTIVKGSSRSAFRNLLVVLQFSISIILISGTFIILGQLEFMKSRKLGFDKEQILVMRSRGDAFRQGYDAFKNELMQNPKIKRASYSNGIPGRVNRVLTIQREGADESETHSIDVINCDFDFIDTYGIEIASGRDFSRDFISDTSGVFLINETAAKKLGFGNNAVGQKIGYTIANLNTVVGVVKDFHYTSLRDPIGPIVIQLNDNRSSLLSLKMETEDVSAVVAYVEEKWNEFEQDRNFSYFFADENFDRLYNFEERLSKIITFFAGLAILIACLGLFGLASFTAEQRTKEIGIRKVLGASTPLIVGMLSKEFAKWVLIANMIALPVAYIIMDNFWLPNFAYKMGIGLTTFIMSGIISILIALLTVSYQAVRAAMTNPVDSLHYE